MSKGMKKRIALLLAAIMAAGSFTGCGGTGSQDNSGTTGDNEETSSSEGEKTGEGITIRLLTRMSGADSGTQLKEEVLAEFQEKFCMGVISLYMIQFMRKNQFQFFFCIFPLRQISNSFLFSQAYGKGRSQRRGVPQSGRRPAIHLFSHRFPLCQKFRDFHRIGIPFQFTGKKNM